MRCSNCKLTCISTKLHCGCGLPWITCQSCRGVGFRCRKPPLRKRRTDQTSGNTSLPHWLLNRRRRAANSASEPPLCKYLRKAASSSSGSVSAISEPSSRAFEVRWPRPEPTTKPLRKRGAGTRRKAQHKHNADYSMRISSISSNFVVAAPASHATVDCVPKRRRPCQHDSSRAGHLMMACDLLASSLSPLVRVSASPSAASSPSNRDTCLMMCRRRGLVGTAAMSLNLLIALLRLIRLLMRLVMISMFAIFRPLLVMSLMLVYGLIAAARTCLVAAPPLKLPGGRRARYQRPAVGTTLPTAH